MLVIQGIQTLQHNCKKEITLPLEIPICNIGLDKELWLSIRNDTQSMHAKNLNIFQTQTKSLSNKCI
jgi:hypothetical protein